MTSHFLRESMFEVCSVRFEGQTKIYSQIKQKCQDFDFKVR